MPESPGPQRSGTNAIRMLPPILLTVLASCQSAPSTDARGTSSSSASGTAAANAGSGARIGFEEARAVFQAAGVQPGEPLPPLRVMNLQGVPVTVEQYRRGRPMVLVTCSLTCNVARRNQAFADDLRIRAGPDAVVLMLYTIDAHPAVDPCPYTGTPWVPKDNERDDVLVRQPTTPEERLALARAYQERFAPGSLMVVDTMDNACWEALGKAPNVGLLVDDEGVVRLRQGWFEPPVMETALQEECREERRRRAEQRALEREQQQEAPPDSR